jgi:hypothetical protein
MLSLMIAGKVREMISEFSMQAKDLEETLECRSLSRSYIIRALKLVSTNLLEITPQGKVTAREKER